MFYGHIRGPGRRADAFVITGPMEEKDSPDPSNLLRWTPKKSFIITRQCTWFLFAERMPGLVLSEWLRQLLIDDGFWQRAVLVRMLCFKALALSFFLSFFFSEINTNQKCLLTMRSLFVRPASVSLTCFFAVMFMSKPLSGDQKTQRFWTAVLKARLCPLIYWSCLHMVFECVLGDQIMDR